MPVAPNPEPALLQLDKAPAQPWAEGYALDFHTVPGPPGAYERTELGALLYALKYEHDRTVVPRMIDLILHRTKSLWWFRSAFLASIIPVPPSDTDRFYQPVFVLTKEISKRTGIPFDLQWLLRTKPGTPLKEIEDPEQRAECLRGAFSISDADRYRDRTILLFDDIYRSGSTLRECTRTAKDLGNVACVYALTVTRTRVKR